MFEQVRSILRSRPAVAGSVFFVGSAVLSVLLTAPIPGLRHWLPVPLWLALLAVIGRRCRFLGTRWVAIAGISGWLSSGLLLFLGAEEFPHPTVLLASLLFCTVPALVFGATSRALEVEGTWARHERSFL